MLKSETILKEASLIYAQRKGYTGKLEIQSDQVKSLCEAMCAAVNKELGKLTGDGRNDSLERYWS